jgi:hypothetical protein
MGLRRTLRVNRPHWFDGIDARGLKDNRSVSIDTISNRKLFVDAEVPGLVASLGRVMSRELRPLEKDGHELYKLISASEEQEWQAYITAISGIDSPQRLPN